MIRSCILWRRGRLDLRSALSDEGRKPGNARSETYLNTEGELGLFIAVAGLLGFWASIELVSKRLEVR